MSLQANTVSLHDTLLHREELEEPGELATVLHILANTQLDILAERLVELAEIVVVLREQVKAFLDDVFVDNLENLVSLQRRRRDVEW